MASPLLDSSHYGAIRAAIDVSLNENALPSTVIEEDIYLQAAIDEVVRRDPDAETRTDAGEVTAVTRAAIYICAARLAPAVPQILRGKSQYLDWQRSEVDMEARAAELRAMAEEELAVVLDPTEDTPGRPTMFARAAGNRGQ